MFLIISPTHKRAEGRAPVWGSEFTSKDAALQVGLNAFFAIFFFGKWYYFGQRKMERKIVLLWGGPAFALQLRKLSRKERKFCEIWLNYREN
jgi:hypothetical protein